MTQKTALLLGLALLGPSGAQAQQFPVATAEHVKAWIDNHRKMAIVDSRNPDEYAQAHIAGALSIPAEQMRDQAARLPRDKGLPIVFYCRGTGCTLSRSAAAVAAELGHTYLLIYQAGMPDWLLKGYPIEKGPDRQAPRGAVPRLGAAH